MLHVSWTLQMVYSMINKDTFNSTVLEFKRELLNQKQLEVKLTVLKALVQDIEQELQSSISLIENRYSEMIALFDTTSSEQDMDILFDTYKKVHKDA